MARLGVRLAADVAQILAQAAGTRVTGLLLPLLLVQVLFLVVTLDLVGELKIHLTKLAGQEQPLPILVEAWKVVIRSVAGKKDKIRFIQ